MQQTLRLAVIAAATGLGVTAAVCRADPIFAPSDFIIAIDGTGESRSQENAPNEGVAKAIDQPVAPTFTKYLNFGMAGTGFIVVPAGGPSTVQSFQLTTANDAEPRDPARYVLMGTNDPIVSTNNSNGLGENWTLVSQGALSLPSTRNTLGPAVSFSNATPYAAYKMYFPRLKAQDQGGIVAGATSMQVSEAQFFDGPGATGTALLAPTNDIRAVDHPVSDSGYPLTERPLEAIDGLKTASSKYLNFAREGTGLIITPGRGSTIARSMQLWAANDTEGRDPTTYQLFGTNDAITSLENSDGTAENWTLITSGTYAMPSLRNTATTESPGPLVGFDNSIAYTSYKILFLDNKGPDGGAVNSIQFSEIVLDTTVPEPAALGLLALAVPAILRRRAR
jgi:hypothetical protein